MMAATRSTGPTPHLICMRGKVTLGIALVGDGPKSWLRTFALH